MIWYIIMTVHFFPLVENILRPRAIFSLLLSKALSVYIVDIWTYYMFVANRTRQSRVSNYWSCSKLINWLVSLTLYDYRDYSELACQTNVIIYFHFIGIWMLIWCLKINIIVVMKQYVCKLFQFRVAYLPFRLNQNRCI